MSVRGLRVHGPGSFGLDWHESGSMASDQVRVSLSYAGICHTDPYILSGRHPNVSYPLVPGHEMSGVVSEVGLGVEGVRVGDAVAVLSTLCCGRCSPCLAGLERQCRAPRFLGTTEDGGWQEELVVPELAIRVLTGTGVSLVEGAVLEPAANAYAAVEAGRLVGGENVVVVGPGPIGLLVAQQARAGGAGSVTVVGLPVDEDRLALARLLGANGTVVVDPAKDPVQARESLGEVIGDGQVDCVVQCAGAVGATRLALSLIGDGGRVILEGFSGSAERVHVSPDEITARSLTIAGVNGWTAKHFDAALERASRGVIDLRTVVTDIFLLDDYEEALRRAVSPKAVKVAFSPRPGEEADHG